MTDTDPLAMLGIALMIVGSVVIVAWRTHGIQLAHDIAAVCFPRKPTDKKKGTAA